MSDSRGAGSVTLDTIIAAAIRSAWVAPKIPNDANQLAAVVTDALLDAGEMLQERWGPLIGESTEPWRFIYRLDLGEVPELRGEPQC